MSKRSYESDDRYNKAPRRDGARDTSSYRYNSSASASATSTAATSGYVHPDRMAGNSTLSNRRPPNDNYYSQQQNSGRYNQQQNYHSNSAAASNGSYVSRAPVGYRPPPTSERNSGDIAAATAAAAAAAAQKEAERLAEEAEQRRLEAQYAVLESEKTEEELAAERAAKRAAILAKYKSQELKPAERPVTRMSAEEKERILAEAGAISMDEIKKPNLAMQEEQKESNGDDIPMLDPSTTAATAASSIAATAASASSSSIVAPSVSSDIDSYDMFSDTALAPEVEAGLDGQRDLTTGGDADAYDDHEGYYRYRLGDLLDGGHYRVTGLQGSGVFSTVLRVRELIPGQAGAASTEGRELVVKLIRANETMYAAGQKELEYLTILSAADPDDKKHCVRLLSNFMHRGHLCLVFEPMNMDLRKVIKKFGSVGLHISAVRSFAKQLMVALRHLKKCRILHGDIKPDNILVNESMGQVKLCDFGSAGKLTDTCEITPYLVSRFYRAPEVILGLPYDERVDLWSVGVCLYELYTGKVLFPGSDNNGMLKCMQDVKGRFSRKILQRGKFTHQHFDLVDMKFEYKRIDSVTKQEMRQKLTYEKPTTDLYHMMKANTSATLTAKETTKLKQLSEFIHACLMLDPNQRPTCEELLQHPFLVE